MRYLQNPYGLYPTEDRKKTDLKREMIYTKQKFQPHYTGIPIFVL